MELVLTPTDYMPYLVIIGLLGAALAFFKCYGALDDHNKRMLREGGIKERVKMGTDYLVAILIVGVISVIGAYVLPGYIFEAFKMEATLSGAAIFAFIWAAAWGDLGTRLAIRAVDKRRDAAKIKELEDEAKAKAIAEAEAKAKAEAEAKAAAQVAEVPVQ